MKTIIIKQTLLSCALIALAACNHNPLDQVNAKNYAPEREQGRKQDSTVFAIEAPDTIVCTETVLCVAQIKGYVPEPGEALISFQGLPNGATYDPVKNSLQYRPGIEVVDMAAHPEQISTVIPLKIILQSSADSITKNERTISIIVNNKIQPVTVNVLSTQEVDEGSTLEQLVEVSSADFPQGPFSLSSSNAPIGTEITAVSGNPNQFKVKFTPTYTFTTKDNGTWNSSVQNYQRSVSFNYQVGLPAGKSDSKSVTWVVNDVRQAPAIAAPETITQGLDVNFSIRAEDLNGEKAPQISVTSTVPFGKISLTNAISTTATDKVTYPSSLVTVKWDQLKMEHIGSITPITFNICVLGNSRAQLFTLCTKKEVKVTLARDVHLAPLLDRASWKAGDLKFVRLGDVVSVKMPIKDAEDSRLPVDVKVLTQQNAAVAWSNGNLSITPKEEGVLQFTVSAESVFGQKVTENFVLEVLPKAWGKQVILTGELPQAESVQTSDLFESSDLISMRYLISQRNLALRETVIITSEALATKKLDANVTDRFFQQSFSLLVASPLASELKGKVADALKSFNVAVKGKFADLASGADLTAFTLAVNPASGLASSKVPMGLKGTLTAFSKNPLILDVSKITPNCVPLFNLQKPGISLSVGVRCKTNDGKVMTILGFEAADILYAEEDRELVKQWFAALGKVN